MRRDHLIHNVIINSRVPPVPVKESGIRISCDVFFNLCALHYYYTQTRDGSSVITPRSNNNVVAEKMANEFFQYFVVPQGSLHVAFGELAGWLAAVHTKITIVFNFCICLDGPMFFFGCMHPSS